MNQITDPALDYPAGQDFNYAVWTTDTRITLANVPWDNTYRDIVKFANRDALNTYIDNRPTTQSQIKTRYARANMPVDLNIPHSAANKYNYLRASNGAQPVPGNDQAQQYYYFVLDTIHIAPNTTRFILQLDIWQTFGFDVSFGRCFIERGHIGMANQDNFADFGRKYLTVPEGMDIGSEYQIVARAKETVMHSRRESHGSSEVDQRPCVLVLSSIQLFGPHGTVDAPEFKTSVPQGYGATSFGLGAYIFENQWEFEKFARQMSDKPWIMQGIQSITLIPSIKRYHPNFEFGSAQLGGSNIKVQIFDYGENITPGGWIGSGTASPDMAYPDMLVHKLAENWRESNGIRSRIPERYRDLRKLYTYPYMFIEATTWNGNVLIIKPESWNDPDATVRERGNIMPPTQRVTFMIYRYNALQQWAEDTSNGDDTGEFLDMAINIDSFPTIPVINNQGIMYLAQHARGLAWEQRSADWSQSRALAGAQTSFDQANMGIRTASEQTRQANRYSGAVTDQTNAFNQQNAILNAIGGIGQGAASGAIAGGAGAVAGAAGGAVGAPMGIVGAGLAAQQASTLNAMSQGQNTASTDIANRSAAFTRDTNMDLARYAAQGDYANTIAGIQARTQDAQLAQPSIKGQFGGDLIDVNYNTSELSLRWKMIDPSAMATVCEYWLRFGYAVNRFAQMPASLMVMNKFTYWKLAESYINAAPMPETFKQAIRGIFEKGVTVWNNPNDIGNIDTATNQPLAGVTL